MKRNHYLILGGVALLAGYLWYRKDKKNKEDKAKNASLKVAPPMSANEASNASGANCRCDNGFVGYCRSGNCAQCCGGYNRKKYTETRRYTF